MNWLALTVLAIVSRAVYGLATKVLSDKVAVTPITQSMLLTTSAGLLAIPLSFLIGGITFEGISSVWLGVLIVVLSQAIGNILYFQGIKHLDAGTTQIAFSSILIWGVLLSVLFLGSRFSSLQFVGILLMLVAVMLIQYRKGSLSLNKSIFFIIASAGLFSLFQVGSAQISGVVNTGAYLLLSYLGSSLILGVLYFKTLAKDFKLLKSQVKEASVTTFFTSGMSLLYFTFSYFAYQQAPDRGIVVILLTAQVILAVLLGITFLNERKNIARKIVAGIIAFIASVLIKS